MKYRVTYIVDVSDDVDPSSILDAAQAASHDLAAQVDAATGCDPEVDEDLVMVEDYQPGAPGGIIHE